MMRRNSIYKFLLAGALPFLLVSYFAGKEYERPELEEISEIIKKLNFRGIDVFVNVNNHYEGSAPLTIRKIRVALDRR